MANNSINGVVLATVEDNIDELGLGRIRIRVDEDRETVPTENLPYAKYCSPLGGGDNVDGAGLYFIPEPGQQVWIIYEGGNPSKPVYLGAAFASEGGRKNPPLEAKAVSSEPLNRIIRTRGGNSLELDDRERDERGGPSKGVRLRTRKGNGLEISNNDNIGIRLGFGSRSGELVLKDRGLTLRSPGDRGLFVNDELDYLQLATDRNNNINLFERKLILNTQDGISLLSSKIKLEAGRTLRVVSRGGGQVFQSGGTQRFISTQDTIFQNAGNFNVNSNQYNLTGQLGSNFKIDFIAPGDGTGSGNIQSNTVSGNILYRVGATTNFLPRITPRGTEVGFGADASTMSTNDPNQSAGFLGRLGVGIQGNAVLEGASGGIFVSGVPVLLPGTAGGTGGRPLVSFVPIVPNPPTPVIQLPLAGPAVPPAPVVGLGPQPAVLGDNLLYTLQKLTLNILNLCTVLTTASPSVAISAVGPASLNPVVVQQLATCIADMTTILNTNLGASPAPTNILSSTVFFDG